MPGVTEVNTIGGFEQQFHITPMPAKMLAYGLSFEHIISALKNIMPTWVLVTLKNGAQYLIRAPGQIKDMQAIADIIVTTREQLPITARM